MLKNLIFASIMLGTFILCSCSDKKVATDDDFMTEAPADTISEETVKETSETVKDVMGSLPSPLEISSMIKESGAGFSVDILNPSDNASKYTTYHMKALNLGIYGADLGYINIYEKTQTALQYLKVVKDLSEALRVGQFFDFNTLSRLAKNNDDIDSLIFLTSRGFEKMDTYLKEKKRGNISVLILAGAWLEGLYLATQVSKMNANPSLRDRIGEQKISFNDLYNLLSTFKSDKNVASLLDEIESLKEVFDKINITYEYGESRSEEVDGMLVVVDDRNSTVEMDDEQLKSITEITENIRSKVISQL